MATFKEIATLVRASRHNSDPETRARFREIRHIIWEYHIWNGMTPERATKLLEALGPTFVKIGQIASNRSDIIPPEYAEAFQSLRAEVPPMPFETVEKIINESLGHPWQETFASIEQTPLGSASIAQTHKAVLLDKPLGKATQTESGDVLPAKPLESEFLKPGMTVAIKVQRPEVAEDMLSDLSLMRQAVALYSVISNQQGIKITAEELVDELDRTTRQEIDFTVELHNLKKFHALLSDQHQVESPVPFPSLSGKKILVMEYIDGPMINNFAALKKNGDDSKKLGHILAESYITQVVDNGYFHADPHPGNILVRDHEVCWIDLGMVGSLSASDRTLILSIMRAAAQNDPYNLMEALLAAVKDSSGADIGELLRAITNILSAYMTEDLSDIDMGELLTRILGLMRDQNLVLPQSWTLLARSLVTVEGVLAEISPTESILTIVQQHVQRHELSKESIESRLRGTATSALESAEATVRIPSQVSHMLGLLNRGEIGVTADMKVPQNFMAAMYSIAGTMGLAMIAMGLFIGSSIVCTTNMTPKFLGVPFLGVFGYLGAFVLSAYIIWRHLVVRHKQKNHEQL